MKTLEQQTIELVNKKIDNNEIFTAFDITTELRNKIKYIKHFEIRKYIRDYYDSGLMGTYTCTLGDFPNVQGNQPWIYHDINTDPLDIKNYNNSKNQKCTINSSTNANKMVHVLDSTSNTVSKNVDGRGTLCVPANLVKKVGLGIFDKVCLDIQNDKIVLKKILLKQDSHYTVDNSYNIRITKFSLNKSSKLKNRKNYNIYINDNNNEIIIK